ncbi:unnamed protein product [Darwinula stevensoni]|uniref:Uncharacterized protein n=1 Tax=Darwinula stevensoni TaxID=69355 RepID=A0A7R9A387_9CRUS|nr:unnamed protein product [Darwinula stevensoni]CAG0890216.1 unnamed protein product [Darwinula stevensoni]
MQAWRGKRYACKTAEGADDFEMDRLNPKMTAVSGGIGRHEKVTANREKVQETKSKKASHINSASDEEESKKTKENKAAQTWQKDKEMRKGNNEREEELKHEQERQNQRLKEHLFNVIMQTKEKSLNIDNFLKTLKYPEYSTPRELRKIIEDDDRFLFSGSSVSLYVKLSICKDHLKPEGCHKEHCQSLHICGKYVFGLCGAAECEEGHNLKTDHNNRVLSQYRLENIERHDLKTFIEQDTVVPDICEEYNIKCNCKEDCLKMHICAEYIMGTCDECTLNHNINDLALLKLLKQANIKLNQSIKELKIHLKKKCAASLVQVLKKKRQFETEKEMHHAQSVKYQQSTNFTATKLATKHREAYRLTYVVNEMTQRNL